MEDKSDESNESTVDENDLEEKDINLKKRKRLYTPRTRARRIVAAGPSQDTEVPVADSELLDFRNRQPPPVIYEKIEPLKIDTVTLTSDYDASCESIDLKENDAEPRETTEPESMLPPISTLRCQETIVNDDPQEGFPPSVDAQLSFDAGYLASSDSVSTSDFRDVVAKYTRDPDVSQWNSNTNPEIRMHYQIIYDRLPTYRTFGAPFTFDLNFALPDPANSSSGPERCVLYYKDAEQNTSGAGSVSEMSGPDDGAAQRTDSRSNTVPYDEEFESMLISRIQDRIREMAGGEYVMDSSAGLTPEGREIKQRFDLLQDGSDDDDPSKRAPSTRDRDRGRRRRRPVPDWMLTDVPSSETLQTEVGTASSASSYVKIEERLANLHPIRYEPSGSPDSEDETLLLRDIRAEGGDQFVESVLFRLQQTLRAGHNFREYHRPPAVRSAPTNRPSQQEPVTTSDEDSDAASSRSSTGRVAFHDKVLVRPLSQDPLLTEYRKPYSKVSKQKLSSVKEYAPLTDGPDYEDSLKDKAETANEQEPDTPKPPPAARLAASPPPPPVKTVPAWKRVLCCVSAPPEPPPPPPPARPFVRTPSPPAAERAVAEPRAAVPESPRRARRQVKRLDVRPLDTDVPMEELAVLHHMFDDQQELCRLSEPDAASSVDGPCNMSDVDSDTDGPNFADFLKACGLDDEKIDNYMNYYRAHRATSGLGRGDGEKSAAGDDDGSWWDKRVRERRHEYRRKRREHRELQRQLETQRDLEVEAQLRRALETQRELLREREVRRELERTDETSRERTELRLEEEVLEKELLRRLLGELQTEQARAREHEKRRTVAKILEEELIARLTQELERQREKSSERNEQHVSQRLKEDASTRQLAARIAELRVRMDENKLLREKEREEETQRLQLLEQLLDKERRRMDLHESQRLRDQDLEASDRALLVELETRSGDEEAKSLKEYEQFSREIMRNREKYKEMRVKLTNEVRKRELVKRKLLSMKEIERENPNLYQFAKVMEDVTSEKGCVQIEYLDGPSPGILKKQTKEGEAAAESSDDKSADKEADADQAGGEINSENVPANPASDATPESDSDVQKTADVTKTEDGGDTAVPNVAQITTENTIEGNESPPKSDSKHSGADPTEPPGQPDDVPPPEASKPANEDTAVSPEASAKASEGIGEAPPATEGGQEVPPVAEGGQEAPPAAEGTQAAPPAAEGTQAAPPVAESTQESPTAAEAAQEAQPAEDDGPPLKTRESGVQVNEDSSGLEDNEGTLADGGVVVVTDPEGAALAGPPANQAGVQTTKGDDSSIGSMTGVNDLYDIGSISD